MKLFLSFLLFFGIYFLVQGQVSYGYDASGNRVERVITSPFYSAPQDSSTSRGPDFSQQYDLVQSSSSQAIAKYSDVLEGTEFSIYPNPTVGKLCVQSKPTESTLLLLDMQGRKIKELKHDGYSEFDLSSFPSGIYFLRIIKEGKVVNWKIIKE